MKKVSVIIVNYNGMSHLDDCITSVLRQTYANFEVIFVDNNSSDGSLEYARNKFPQLIFVANDKNLGYAGGINSGLAIAAGEYIAPLTQDTEVSPTWLSAMVGLLDENPRAGAVTPKILLFDDRGRINSLGSNIHITGLGFCRGLDSKDDSSISITRVPGVHGCSYLIRREILELLGGAPVHCFMGNDDVVISWAINLMDWEIYCIPEAVVYRKYKLEMNPDKFFILERNRHELLLTTLRARTLAILLPALAVIEILVWAYCLIKGKSYLRAKFRAISAVRRDLYDIRRRRARLKQMRRISDLDLLKKFRFNLEWRQLLRILR